MKIIKNIRIIAIACIAITMGLFMSCDDDDEKNSGVVELLSFGPAGVQHGQQITFIGNNLDKITAIELVGASIPNSSFVEQTRERITLTVPVEAEAGLVTLKYAEGDIVTKTAISFDVPVTIASFTPEARSGATITITGQFMNWVEEVRFSEDLPVTEFVSQSLNELVVTVPQAAQTGTIILVTGGTEPLEVESEVDLVVTLPSITGLSPTPVERGADLTITGENLDLTMALLFKGLTEPITTFVSQTATKLVVTVPDEANKGAITLIAHSLVEVESQQQLEIAGDLPPLAPLAAAIYIDALENGFGDWSYGGAVDKASTDNVRDGASAVKKTFDGSWDAVRFAGSSISTDGKTEFAFSVFGGPGMEGQKMNVIINDNWGIQTITITEGEWVEHKFTIDDFGNPASIDDWGLQAHGSTGLIYIDHIGLR